MLGSLPFGLVVIEVSRSFLRAVVPRGAIAGATQWPIVFHRPGSYVFGALFQVVMMMTMFCEAGGVQRCFFDVGSDRVQAIHSQEYPRFTGKDFEFLVTLTRTTPALFLRFDALLPGFQTAPGDRRPGCDG